jgi:hypothetical protein
MIFILLLESGRGSRLRIEDTGGLLRPFCAIPRPTGTPEIAEEERPGVTPWRASYVIEFCPRKNGDGLGNVTLDATDRLPYYSNQSVATRG